MDEQIIKTAIEKAKSLGFTGEDYELALEFIWNNDKSKPEVLEADNFTGYHQNGIMYYTLPLLGASWSDGEFDTTADAKIIHDAWDSNGDYFRFEWQWKD